MSNYWEREFDKWFAKFAAGTTLKSDDFDMSVRLYNVIRNSGLTMVEFLKDPIILLNERNCGRKSLREFKDWIKWHNIRNKCALEIDHDLLYDLTNSQMLEVFRAGFECLGNLSPFENPNIEIGIHHTSEVIWCMPTNTGNKNNSFASIGKYDFDPNFIQFSANGKKFNQLAAIKKLIDFGVIKL